MERTLKLDDRGIQANIVIADSGSESRRHADKVVAGGGDVTQLSGGQWAIKVQNEWHHANSGLLGAKLRVQRQS
jgi:phage head maturation protease